MALQSRVVLSRTAYAVTWVAENIGEQPEALFVLPDTATPDRLAASTRQAADELGTAGLFDQRNGVHPDLVATFRLLARPQMELFGTVAHQQHTEPFSVLAAAGGGMGVLAVLDSTSLALHPVRPAGLAEALVAVLPEVPPAHGQSVTLPASVVDGAGSRHVARDEPFSVFAGQAPADPAVTRVKRLAAEPRAGGAQFFVAVRDQHGRRRRSAYPINVIDVESGRWFLHRQHNPSGEVWLTAAPATPHALVTKLDEALRAL